MLSKVMIDVCFFNAFFDVNTTTTLKNVMNVSIYCIVIVDSIKSYTITSDFMKI